MWPTKESGLRGESLDGIGGRVCMGRPSPITVPGGKEEGVDEWCRQK